MAVRAQVRAIYGASLSPDATAFANIVDDGGYPRAVQRLHNSIEIALLPSDPGSACGSVNPSRWPTRYAGRVATRNLERGQYRLRTKEYAG